MINIGSGLALFGVVSDLCSWTQFWVSASLMRIVVLNSSTVHQATVLCDIVVLYCMKKKYYYREKKYKYVEDYELVSVREGTVASFPIWRDWKSTSNRDFEPLLWGNFVFVTEANFYLKAVVGKSTRNKYCHVSWVTTLGEGNVWPRTCHVPTAPLFWVAVLGSCLLRAVDNSSVPVKSFLLGFGGSCCYEQTCSMGWYFLGDVCWQPAKWSLWPIGLSDVVGLCDCYQAQGLVLLLCLLGSVATEGGFLNQKTLWHWKVKSE